MQSLESYTVENKPVAKKKQLNLNFNAFANITEQYASETAFLWLLRSRALSSPLYYTADMIELENRINANLQGLFVADEMGWQA